MSDASPLRLPRWPFYVGDLLLLTLAAVIFWQGGHSPGPGRLLLSPWEAWTLVVCVLAGAGFGVLPHLLDHRAASRNAEAQRLDHAVLQVQNIESVARQISSATAGWQAIQDEASKAVQSAQEIADTMTVEARAFQDFVQKANDTERAHLRLEVEKLRRAEGEWLQVLTRILDHTYAMHQAAVRSGQPGLAEQIGNFQRACRDAARRVGLAAFTPRIGEPFDPQQHQLAPADKAPPPDPVIAESLATGYRYQGQVIRLPAVVLKGAREDQSDLSMRMINQRREQEGAPKPLVESPPPSEEEPATAPATIEAAPTPDAPPPDPGQAATPEAPQPEQESLHL
jgi:molecular chaperone GrpE (heat shock protein)